MKDRLGPGYAELDGIKINLEGGWSIDSLPSEDPNREAYFDLFFGKNGDMGIRIADISDNGAVLGLRYNSGFGGSFVAIFYQEGVRLRDRINSALGISDKGGSFDDEALGKMEAIRSIATDLITVERDIPGYKLMVSNIPDDESEEIHLRRIDLGILEDGSVEAVIRDIEFEEFETPNARILFIDPLNGGKFPLVHEALTRVTERIAAECDK